MFRTKAGRVLTVNALDLNARLGSKSCAASANEPTEYSKSLRD